MTRFVGHILESLESRTLLSTSLLVDLAPGPGGSFPNHLTNFGELIYFTASSSGGAPALWKTDGTAPGTVPLSSDGTINELLIAGDRLYFYEIIGSGNTQTWNLGSIDSKGDIHRSLIPRPYTILVNAHPFPAIGAPRSIDGKLYYYQLQSSAGGEWFSTDANGDVQPTGISDRDAFAEQGIEPSHSNTATQRGKTYFAWDDGTHGRELGVTTDAILTGRILRVFGTPGIDRITITSAGLAEVNEILTVRLNAIAPSFPVNDLDQIRIYTGDGNDRVILDESGFPIETPVSVLGGAGNDLIKGASGKDTLYGEDGDDSIYGGAANDYLFGGIGNDRLNGGGGRDILWGGEGQDTFVSSRTVELRDFNSLEDLLG